MKPLRLPWNSFHASAGWGAAVWLLLLCLRQPDFRQHEWATLVLQLAALVWVPMSLALLNWPKGWLQRLVFPAAVALVVAMQQPAGWRAALWALPWLAVTAIIFLAGIEALFQSGRSAWKWSVAGAQIFLLIGGLATVADRLGLQPFGFDPAIILLTGVHFHYAGLIFPLLLGWPAQRWPAWFSNLAAWLAVATVPLTAAGITLSQIMADFRLEAVAAGTVALSGWLGALGYFRAIWRENLPWPVRLSWGLMAVCLLFSMSLGLGYALRPYWPTDWLTIPSMRALHGTANALGVAGGGLLGWYFFKRKT